MDFAPNLPRIVVAKILELIQRRDVQSVSFPYNDRRVWKALCDEQVRRSASTGVCRQDAFALSGPDGGLQSVPIDKWGGKVHIPYEGMCGGDLVVLPKWRNVFVVNARTTGRLSTVIRAYCFYLLSPRDFGVLNCAHRTVVGEWVLYQSCAPYTPCRPLAPD